MFLSSLPLCVHHMYDQLQWLQSHAKCWGESLHTFQPVKCEGYAVRKEVLAGIGN